MVIMWLPLKFVVAEWLVCTPPGGVEWQHPTRFCSSRPPTHRYQLLQSRWLHRTGSCCTARSYRGHHQAARCQVRRASNRDSGWMRGCDGATPRGAAWSCLRRPAPCWCWGVHRCFYYNGWSARYDPITPGCPVRTTGRHWHSHQGRMWHPPDDGS